MQRELSAAEAASAVTSPNDRPGLALIGCGGQGQSDAANASTTSGRHPAAVCDVDQKYAGEAARRFAKDGKAPDKYSDFRKVLERDDIHAIVQATPDHWHTLINIGAAKTKKDVAWREAADADD